MKAQRKLRPLEVKTVYVIGIAEWLYEYASLRDAAACVQQLSKLIEKEGARLDYIEVRVEFSTGESERCAFKEEERVFDWLERFE